MDRFRHLRTSHRGWRRTPVRTYLFGVLSLLLLAAVVPIVGFADGSRTSYPTDATCGTNSSCRASIEWSTSTYGPTGSAILRRTLFTVYLKAGETLETGSSAVGVGTGDIWVWTPGQITNDQAAALPGIGATAGTPGFKCSNQAGRGQITSRALETAGPQSADGTGNTTGYVPCTYTAPATGLYKVGFFGPSGPSAAATGTPTGDITLSSANDFSTAQGTHVSAWDLTVRQGASSTADITGRVFTYVLSSQTGANNRPLNGTIYATTLDGYVYRANLNGLDPNAFLIYGNEQGFLDPQGNPLYHDVVGHQDTVNTVDGGVAFAPPQYPISLTPLSADTLAAISVTTNPQPVAMSNLTFAGASSGSHVYTSKGGTFAFDANKHGTYEIVISADGVDFDPTKLTNRVLRGVVDAGHRTVSWDGKDNAGNAAGAGTSYKVKGNMLGGVYHFPLIDAENSTKGGPSFTLTNPPGSTCAFGGSAAGCRTAFYDDRGYHTTVGDVGTPGTVLCGANAPGSTGGATADHSDPINGYDSATAQRSFGNTNAAGNGADCVGQFGDRKGLDTWTYYPSAKQDASFTVDPLPAQPRAVDDSGTTPANTTLHVASTDSNGLLANDGGTNITVTSHTTPAHGSVTTTANGGWDYTPATGFSGTDTFGYTITDDAGQTSSATVTVTVTPLATNDTYSVGADQTLTVPATGAPSLLANDAGTTLRVTSHTATTNGGVLSAFGTDGSFSYTPAGNFSGDDTFTYTVTDAANRTATATATIHVRPRALDDTSTAVSGEPTAIPATALLGNDHGTSLQIISTSPQAGDTAVVNPDGSVTYTSATNASGPRTFDYTVRDSSGQTSTATMHLTVTPEAIADSNTVPTNTPTAIGSGSAGVLTNDHGTGLTVTAHTNPAHGTVVINADGTGTYTPSTDYTGPDSFTYTLTDASNQTSTATVTLNVTPTAPDDAYSVRSGQLLTVPAPGVLANDHGTGLVVASHTGTSHGTLTMSGTNGAFTYQSVAGYSGTDTFTYVARDSGGQTTAPATVTITITPDGQPDTYTVAADGTLPASPSRNVLGNDGGTGTTVLSNTQPAHGTATVNPDGTFSYTPDGTWSGPDSFTYTARDASNQSYTQTVTIDVTPVAVADTATIGAGGSASPSAPGVLGNDLGAGLTSSVATGPSHGTVVLNGDGSYTYTPSPTFSGVDTFTYTVTDASNQTSPAAPVTITVRPVAVADTLTTTAGSGPLTVDGSTLLANDHGGPLTITSVGNAQHGTISGTGPYTFTPDTGFSGDASFTYTVSDPSGQTSTATVTVRVNPQAVGDTGTTPVDTTLVVAAPGVLGNDQGSGLTVTGHTDPSHGTLSIGAAGGYTYTPTTGYSGPDSFTYTATDSSGRTSTAAVSLTVTPVAPDDAYATDANTTLTVPAPGVLANDSPGLQVLGHTDPASGTLTMTATDGSFSYVPATDTSGTVTFTYTASDGTSSQTATVTVTVRPTAAPDSGSVVAGSTYTSTASVLANDHGTGLQVTAHGTPSHGTVSIASSGDYTYTPAAGYSGPDSFTYIATDASGQSVTQTVSLTVTPVAAADTITVDAGSSATSAAPGLLANDHGDSLAITGHTNPSHGSVTLGADGAYTYTPDPTFSGTDTFTYTVTDSSNQTATAPVTVTIRPVAVADTLTTTAGAPPLSIAAATLLANDHGGPLTITSVGNAQHGTIGGTGPYTFTPATGFSGDASFTYTVTDGSGQTSTATVVVRVDPQAFADTGTTPVNTPLVVAAPGVLANDLGTGLAVTAHTNPAHGTLSIAPNGSYTYTPTTGYSGPDSFTYTATDNANRTTTATVSLTVTPTVADDSYSTNANTTLTVAAPGVLGNDSPSGLTVTSHTNPSSGTLTMTASNGSFSYAPATDTSGRFTFTYTASDGTTTGTATVTITVAPTAGADSGSVVAGSTLSPATSVLANDHGSGLSVTAHTAPGHGAVSIGATGLYSYTPAAGYSGPDSFTYTATDSAGQTVTQTVSIVVTPKANDDTGSTTNGTPLVVDAAHGVLSNDLGSGLSVTAHTNPTHGTLTIAANGSYTYTPTGGYSGADAFTYTVTDSSGRTSSATVSLSVGLTATDDTATTSVDTALTVPASSGVLANDRGSSLQVTGNTSPGHGTATVNADGSYLYTPAAGYSGLDSFTYTVRDGSGATATATVRVRVTPVAVDDTGRTSVGATLTVPTRGVLANDRGTALTVTASTTPQHGSVVVNADGSYAYSPKAGYSGADSFTYTVADPDGGTSTAIVRLTVTPTAVDDEVTTPVNIPVSFTPVANDHGTGLTVTGVTQPAHGKASVVNGGIRFTPDKDWSGVTTCVYTATDASGQTVTATATIRVTPVARADRTRTAESIPVALTPVVNDNGSGLHISGVTQPPESQGVVIIRDGRLVFHPADGFVGTVTFSYTVTDGAGQTATAVDTVVVDPLGDAVPDSATTTQGRPVTVDPTANDPGHATFVLSTLHLRDPRTNVVVSSVTIKGQGTFVVDPRTGKVVFTPVKGFHGDVEPVTYQVLDTAGVLHVSTIEVTVTQATSATATSSGGSGSGSSATGDGLPGTGSPIGWQVPIAGVMLLVAGLVLTLRRRREPAPIRVKGGARRAATGGRGGTHRQH